MSTTETQARPKKAGPTQTTAKTPKPRHVHLFDRTFPSDVRYQMCACGTARRADRLSDNPCVQWWGRGPSGKTCRDCGHLREMRQSRRWYKCEKRTDLTNSPATDQLLRWEACGRFVQSDEGI